MNDRISLWNPRSNVASDDAGTTILKYSCPPLDVQAPYELEETSAERVLYVPSLQSLCIKRLVDFPEQVHQLGRTRLLYHRPKARADHDVLRELIPDFSHSREEENGSDPDTFLTTVDPRLWAVLVQVYTDLPESFRTYTLPLTDIHLPLLQRIPSTSHFSLVTVVELHACPDLNDHTIVRLRDLHSLAALDISMTKITPWGIKSFAKTLAENESFNSSNSRRLVGPWQLRILSLRDCKNVEDSVFSDLLKFPLLCVIDLRGTRCTPSLYKDSPFLPSLNGRLFHPTPLLHSLNGLCLSATGKDDGSAQSKLRTFSHSPPSYLRVTAQYHSPRQNNARRRESHEYPTLLGPSNRSSETVQSTRESTGHSADIWSHTAMIEARRQASNTAALAFYATPVPRSVRPNIPADKRDFPPAVTPEDYTTKDISSPLALSRSPPSWQTLVTLSCSPIDADSRQHKRARTVTEEPAPLAATKRNESAVKSLLQRDGTIMIRSEFEKAKAERRKAAFRSNPFKTMPISVFEEERRKAASSSTTFTSPSSGATTPASASRRKQKKPSYLDDMDPGSLVRPSTLPIPPRSTKPLHPISSFPIPQLPPEVIAKMRSASFSSKHSSPANKPRAANQRSVQSKLSDFVKGRPMSISTVRGSLSFESEDPGRAGKPIPTDRRCSNSSKNSKGQTGNKPGVSMRSKRESSESSSMAGQNGS